MNDWIPQERDAKTVGPFTITPMRPRGSGGEGAHHVDFGDGRAVLVLPTPQHSTRARFSVLHSVLSDCVAIGAKYGPIGAFEAFDPRAYLLGHLAAQGIPWEPAASLQQPTIEEWFAHYLRETFVFHPDWPVDVDQEAKRLLKALGDDGWEIRRREVEA